MPMVINVYDCETLERTTLMNTMFLLFNSFSGKNHAYSNLNLKFANQRMIQDEANETLTLAPTPLFSDAMDPFLKMSITFCAC